eukprot:TRINITY_DN5943_c0_g1_i2.p1 TRINITY_DN5943_c0_g1~~TRINITY_DN5943_c0_g1_i2.p1  ORF type:complete len:600 (-),score=66.63 TRINITY_DN5943_c0_g1_i2:278-2077(-)
MSVQPKDSFLETIGWVVHSSLGIGIRLMPFKAPQTKKISLPQEVPRVTPTSLQEIDNYIDQLQSAAPKWVQMSCEKRAELLLSCIPHVLKVADEGTEQLIKIKGAYDLGKAEERSTWATVIQTINGLAETLKSHGKLTPNRIFSKEDGQLVADVHPQGIESILNYGFKSQVWIQKGMPASQGKLYKDKRAGLSDTDGGVALVLGAGNFWMLGVLDAFHKLVYDDQVVVLKMNPTLELMGSYIEQALKPIFDQGFIKIVYGGAEQGKYLTDHPKIASMLMTGSNKTYDAIIWGDDLKKVGKPKNTKPFTAELGNVTPLIVVPGDWTEEDMRYHIQYNIAPFKIIGCSNICFAPEVIITSRTWKLRGRFIEILREELDNAFQRKPWYPGIFAHYNEFLKRFPNCEKLGKNPDQSPEALPNLVALGLSPDEAWVDEEKFCQVLQEVSLDDCQDAGDFMQKATEFANERCFGQLACSVFIPPSTQAHFLSKFDKMISQLKYGTVVVNGFSGLGHSIQGGVWGAYPGNTPENIGSGTGFVQNKFMFDYPEKHVVYCRWRLPYNVLSLRNSNLDTWVKAVLDFMKMPYNILKFFNIFYQLFRMRV